MKKSLSGTRLKTAGALLFALCCSTIIVYSTSNIPLLERSITNDLIQGNNCVAQILLFAVMYALRAAFKLIRNHTCAYAGNTVVNQLREYTLEKLIEGHRRQTSTYEYTVLTNDLPVIADLLSSQTFVFTENLLILLLAVCNIWRVNAVMGVVFLCGLMALLWSSVHFAAKLQPIVSKIKDRTLEMSDCIKEIIKLNKTIWAVDLQSTQRGIFERQASDFANCQSKQVQTDALGRGRIELLSRTTFIIAIIIGTFIIIYRDADIGMLMMVNAYSKSLTNVTVKLGEIIRFGVSSKESVRRYRGLLTEYIGPSDIMPARERKPHKVGYKINRLQREDETIFQDIQIDIEQGEFIVFYGNSGSGKTVLADALAGIDETADVDYFFDGIKVGSINQYWRILSYCQQQPVFFSASLENNITLWNDRVDLKMLGEFCALDFVDSLPNGYNTLVSAENPFMSGGERQRVLIARALARTPYVLILDDCLDAIDLLRKKQILERLKMSAGNRITVLFTSDISLCAYADRVYRIEDGTVIAVEGADDQL